MPLVDGRILECGDKECGGRWHSALTVPSPTFLSLEYRFMMAVFSCSIWFVGGGSGSHGARKILYLLITNDDHPNLNGR